MCSYITEVKTPDGKMCRHKLRIEGFYGLCSFNASFKTMQQLEKFASTLGFTFRLEIEQTSSILGWVKRYSMSHEIRDTATGFWRLSEVPDGAKKIKALCNGRIVDCYFINDGKTITFYRPNPNATVENKNRYKTQEEYEKAVAERIYWPNSLEFDAVYFPLSQKEHIAHHNKYGTY